MNRNRLSCLTPLALISVFVTLVILIAARLLAGGTMFTPGLLNAQPGNALGGVTSHAQIGGNCGACHPAPWSAQSMADRCITCHTTIAASILDTSSLHGALAAQAGSFACRQCHPEHRGPNATLTVIDPAGFPHSLVGFSLETHARRSDGAAFTCADCHPDRITIFDLRVCTDCHRQMDSAFTDSHAQAYGTDCLSCHNGADRLSRFDHSQAAFPLTGAHQQVDCAKCHSEVRTLTDFKKAPLACEACHLGADAHAGKFGSQCGTCHTPAGWIPAAFDHNLAAFKLEGKHTTVACEQCHSKGYAGTPTDCFACHQKDDAHSGEFGTQCGTCHNPTGWQNATFDHSLAAFPLDGAHLNVACKDCHLNNVFKGTPTACAGCHAEPDFHLGMFTGQACSDCHTTTAWRPATYTGPHPFPYDHGGRNNICSDCHQPNLTTWTCYPCHNQAEIERKHREEGITDFADCLACHPTGRKEGGGGGGGGD